MTDPTFVTMIPANGGFPVLPQRLEGSAVGGENRSGGGDWQDGGEVRAPTDCVSIFGHISQVPPTLQGQRTSSAIRVLEMLICLNSSNDDVRILH